MKILTVDDHALFREGLELVLARISPEAIVVHAATLREAKEKLATNDPFDLVLTDLGLPNTQGIDALKTIRALAPATPTIVLASSENTRIVREAIENGAAGYMFKSVDSEELARALKIVVSGRVYLPPAAVATEPANEHATAVTSKLTERKRQILRSLIRGLSNKEIARELSISNETVKSHAREIYKILGVSNRTQAVFAIAQSQEQL